LLSAFLLGLMLACLWLRCCKHRSIYRRGEGGKLELNVSGRPQKGPPRIAQPWPQAQPARGVGLGAGLELAAPTGTTTR